MTDLDKHQLRPLLQRVIAKDAGALNDLLTQLRPYLHALVRRTLGPDWKDASDVVQSSLRRINENIIQRKAGPRNRTKLGLEKVADRAPTGRRWPIASTFQASNRCSSDSRGLVLLNRLDRRTWNLEMSSAH